VRRWRELVIGRENGEVLFDRPKPTAGCSANGRRRRFTNLNFSANSRLPEGYGLAAKANRPHGELSVQDCVT
jgi:hypothetical protein